MAYVATKWVNGETDVDAEPMNNIEKGISDLDERVTKIEIDGTASAIKDLKDVTLTEVQSGDTLVYDSETEKWKNGEGTPNNVALLSGGGSPVSVGDIIKSPFNLAINDGVYGYLKKEADTEVFVPFKSGTNLKIASQLKPTYGESGTVTDGATFEFDFEVKMFLILFSTNSPIPFDTNTLYTEIGYLDDGILKIAGKLNRTEISQSFHCYMPTQTSVNIKDSGNKRICFCIAFSEVIDALLPCINGL